MKVLYVLSQLLMMFTHLVSLPTGGVGLLVELLEKRQRRRRVTLICSPLEKFFMEWTFCFFLFFFWSSPVPVFAFHSMFVHVSCNFFFLCFSDAQPQLLHTSPHSFYPLAPKDGSPTALYVP